MLHFEGAAKMALVIESGGKADLGEGLIRFRQLIRGLFQAQSSHIIADRTVIVAPKGPGKMRRVYSDSLGQP